MSQSHLTWGGPRPRWPRGPRGPPQRRAPQGALGLAAAPGAADLGEASEEAGDLGMLLGMPQKPAIYSSKTPWGH